MSQMLAALLLAGLLGMIGQGVRAVVGLKGLALQALDPNVPLPEAFNPTRLIVSLVIGFVAGALAGTAMGIEQVGHADLTRAAMLGLMAAGYSGTDFIEGFISNYLPGAQGATGGKGPQPE
nr:hypothetical protein [uncultured Lichenicoccus sp.]